MRIETTLLTILNGIKEAGRLQSVTYQQPFKANIDTASMTAPMAVLYVITDHKLDIRKGTARESAEVNIFLMDRNTRLDYDGTTATAAYIDSMAAVGIEVIARIRQDSTIRIDSDAVEVKSVFDQDDTNLAGVSLQFRCTETQGVCISIPQPDNDEDNEANTDEAPAAPADLAGED